MAQRTTSDGAARFAWLWLPVAAYYGVIWYYSSKPNLTPPPILWFTDKYYHFGEYFLLGLLLTRAWRSSLPLVRTGALAALVIGSAILIGMSDEYHQSFVPGRDSSVYDLMADTAGASVAHLVFRLLARG